MDLGLKNVGFVLVSISCLGSNVIAEASHIRELCRVDLDTK